MGAHPQLRRLRSTAAMSSGSRIVKLHAAWREPVAGANPPGCTVADQRGTRLTPRRRAHRSRRAARRPARRRRRRCRSGARGGRWPSRPRADGDSEALRKERRAAAAEGTGLSRPERSGCSGTGGSGTVMLRRRRRRRLDPRGDQIGARQRHEVGGPTEPERTGALIDGCDQPLGHRRREGHVDVGFESRGGTGPHDAKGRRLGSGRPSARGLLRIRTRRSSHPPCKSHPS